MSAFTIRPAHPGDEEAIYSLLRGLAEFENLSDKFQLTRGKVARDVFGSDPALHAALAFAGDETGENGVPIGIATWYWTYSSFAARRGLFIEDIFVLPSWRGQGLGRSFFGFLAGQAAKVGGARLDWLVLDWNEKAIAFYKSLGGKPVEEWQIYRLEGAALDALAK